MGSISKKLGKPQNKLKLKDPHIIAKEIREASALGFIERNGISIPPVAYRIAPDGKTYVIAFFSDKATKSQFYAYLAHESHTKPTAAIVILSFGSIKQNSNLKGDGQIKIEETNPVNEILSAVNEVLVQVIQLKNGEEIVWVAPVYKTPIRVGEWTQVDKSHGFQNMFGSPN